MQVNAAGDLCAICQEKMHAPILLRCKHIFCEDCVSEWWVYYCLLFSFSSMSWIFFPSYFASVLEDFNLYSFSGLRGKGRAHCAELWSRQQISDHLVMDQLVCFSRYSDCTTVETWSFLLWRSRYLIEAAFSRLPSTLVNLTVSYSTLFMSCRGN